jgi:TRAP-type C4-dicarboxylate transport system permease small subunit
MIIITFADIVMRFMGNPIPGVYEVVAFLGIAVTMFALPGATLKKTHVAVDMLTEKLGETAKTILRVFTRILVIIFFFLTAWYLYKMGMRYMNTKTVTMMLRVPFYPVIFMAAFASLVQCLVGICEIFAREEPKTIEQTGGVL